MESQCYYETCIVIGTGQFAYLCAGLLKRFCRLDGVYEYGAMGWSGLESLCKKADYPYTSLVSKRDADELMERLSAQKKKVFVLSASNTYLFPDYICRDSNIDIINYHPALVNAHLGINAEAWAIFEQNKVAGVTWHKVITEVDQGRVYIQGEILLDANITSLKLMLLQYKLGVELLRKILPDIISGKQIQDVTIKPTGRLHYAADIPNNGLLDLGWKKDKVSSFLRCMDYGRLNILGTPALYESGKRYIWDGYKIIENPTSNLNDKCNDRMVIKDDTVFILKNFREYRENVVG